MSDNVLLHTVYVQPDDPRQDPMPFGPGDKVPEWALAKIGAHNFESGDNPAYRDPAAQQSASSRVDPSDSGPGAVSADTLRAQIAALQVQLEDLESAGDADLGPMTAADYLKWSKDDLVGEVEQRNESRDEHDLVVVEAPGNKPELADALVADDEAHPAEPEDDQQQ